MTSLFISKLVCCTNLRSVAICKLPKSVVYRKFSNDVRESARRARQKTLREQAMAPAGEGSFKVGKGALAGAAAVGVGALCYYGLGLSDEAGAAEKSLLWPDYVKKRIRATYFYFGSSLIVTAASALVTFNSTSTIQLLIGSGVLNMLGTFGFVMLTGMIAQKIRYKEGFGIKQMAWLLHVGTVGTMLAPLCFLGGPVLVQTALYSAGVIGGLTIVAVCAPGRKFLSLGAPLGMGLGVVIASSIGSFFFPRSTTLGSRFYFVGVYGGLALFSLLVLYDTQHIILLAEKYPVNYRDYDIPPYDPINAAMTIYSDALNIFSNILTILLENDSKKRST